MRISSVLFFLAVIVGTGLASVSATDQAQAAYCKPGAKLGVSRTVTLKTGGGARFGSSHGGHRNFLRDKEVVLTFDDGPIPATTNKVLHELERHCTKATFFMVGQMAKNYPSMVRKVLAKGHTVGIHSYSHRNLGQTNAKTAVQDVDRSIKAINKAAGRKVTAFFRFPYLSENRAVNNYLKKRNYGVFAIDVDSLDYRMSSPNSMVNRIMSELRRKGRGIILMHDIKKVTANGLGQLLTRLNDEGYKLVHIKGSGGKALPEPYLVAGNDEKPEPVRKWTLKPSIEISYDGNGDLAAGFKRPKMSKKRPAKPENQKKVRVAKLAQKERLQRNKQAFRNKIDLNKKKFRDALKLRLITQ